MTPAAYALVNTSAVKYNLQMVREYAPKAKVMAVIKANAYGHGLMRIAEALDEIDAMAVARVDEGIRLRQAGITKKIAILEGNGKSTYFSLTSWGLLTYFFIFLECRLYLISSYYAKSRSG